MTYSTILFDLDHTLFDSDASELGAFEATMRAVGIDQSDRHLPAYLAINRALWAAVERHELSPGRVRLLRFERLVVEARLDADPGVMADLFVEGLASHGELYPGALAVLDRLAEDATLALLTNGLSEVQRTRLDRLGIAGHFDAVVISAEIGCSKPAAAFFDVAFEMLGGPPRDTALMVGDSLSADVRGAADYGVATCWYNPNGRSAAADAGVDHQIGDLAELPDLVC